MRGALFAWLDRTTADRLLEQVRDRFDCGRNFRVARVDEEPDGHHERRQPVRQRGRTCETDISRALVVQHEADRVGPSLDGGVDIGLAGQPANLDACALVHHHVSGVHRVMDQGSQSIAAVRCGIA